MSCEAGDAILEKLAGIEDELILPGEQKNTYSLIQRDRLDAALASVIACGRQRGRSAN